MELLVWFCPTFWNSLPAVLARSGAEARGRGCEVGEVVAGSIRSEGECSNIRRRNVGRGEGTGGGRGGGGDGGEGIEGEDGFQWEGDDCRRLLGGTRRVRRKGVLVG